MADTINNNQGTFNTISSQTLTPQPKLVVPPTKPDTTPYQSLIDGALTSLPDVTKSLDANQKSADSALSKIALNSNELLNKEQYSQDQQDLQGVKARQTELDNFNAQFNDLGAQIKGLSRASQAVPLQVQENNLGTGATDAGVAPQETGMLRQNAIKALTLASQADVLGAQITNTESRLQRAKDNAQLAVDLKFKPLEQQNALLKDMLDLNKKYITDPLEKKKTEATSIALTERSRLLAEQKADEKANTDLMINANSQMAPASVIAKAKAMIAKGAKPMDVANVLGVYAGDYIGNQVKLKDMKIKDLEYAIKNNEFNLSKAMPVGQNADGTVVKGSGVSSIDRNSNTVEQLIRKNAKTIPDTAQNQIGTAIQVVKSIEEFAKKNPDGTFEGIYPTAGFVQTITPTKLRSTKSLENDTPLGAINLKVQQWASGAALTKEQTDLVYGMVPVKGDTDDVVRAKMKSLTNYMNKDVEARLSSAGVKYRAEESDLYDNSVAAKTKNALGTGYSPTEVVNSWAQDPVMGPKIQQAKDAKWSDEQIATYLQTLTDQPQDQSVSRDQQIIQSRPFGG